MSCFGHGLDGLKRLKNAESDEEKRVITSAADEHQLNGLN